jgi:DNA-binding NarL/FixJ family response regulator
MTGDGSFRRPARILIVDDHPVMRLGLRNLISDEADFEVCGEAADAAAALRLVEERDPDLMLIDVSLRGSSGLELIKQVGARPSPPKMLVISMHDEMLFAERALRAGALGYINKEEAPDTVVEAIRHALAGKVYLSGRMTDRVLQLVAGSDRELERPAEASLSDRELEVFEHIGRGVGTRDIAERLGLSVKTIETYRENIKRKLALQSNTELIRRAVQWVLQDD